MKYVGIESQQVLQCLFFKFFRLYVIVIYFYNSYFSIKFYFYFLGPCFETTSLIPTSISPVVTNVASAFLCQNECQRRGDCLKFVYDTLTQNCYLNYQAPFQTKILILNGIIGPRSCVPNNYLGKKNFKHLFVLLKNKVKIPKRARCFKKLKKKIYSQY